MTSRRLKQQPSPTVTRALLAVCHTTWPSEEFSAVETEEFIAAARLHRIAPLAYIASRGVADDIATRLREDRDQAMAVTMKTTLTLGLLARVLDGVPWITFKGLVLSLTAHPAPGLRTFSDVDVLIEPHSLRTACVRLRAAGWRPIDYDDMLSPEQPPGEMHWLSPNGMQLDLHWSMINSAFRRDLFDVRTDELLSRRVIFASGFTTVPTLDPEDTLIHTCLHAALDGASRLLQLIDADGAARRVSSWDLVVERAFEWRASAQVWLVLARAQAAVGTPLPDHLSEALGVGAPLRESLRFVDRFVPVANVRAPHGLARFASRAVSPTLRATLAMGGRHARLGVVDRFRPDVPIDRHRVPATESTKEKFLWSVEATVSADHHGSAPD